VAASARVGGLAVDSADGLFRKVAGDPDEAAEQSKPMQSLQSQAEGEASSAARESVNWAGRN
jgi:hypothetical protein